MKTYSKEFQYQDYTFTTTIILNALVEKRMNGKRFHRITTTGIFLNQAYFHQTDVNSSDLKSEIKHHHYSVTNYINDLSKTTLSEEERLLEELNFIKNE
jgi:hypothetical protein